MTWPFIILCGLFFIDLLLVLSNVRFLKQLYEVSDWINQKQLDLIGIDDAKHFLDTIQEYLRLFGEWFIQTKNIIIPGILLTQIATAYVIGALMNQEYVAATVTNFVAAAQAAVIVSVFVLVKRVHVSYKITHEVNDEVIKWTIVKASEDIEDEHLDEE